MKVVEVITRIGQLSETADCLSRMITARELMNGDAAIVNDAIRAIEEYIAELENKIVVT